MCARHGEQVLPVTRSLSGESASREREGVSVCEEAAGTEGRILRRAGDAAALADGMKAVRGADEERGLSAAEESGRSGGDGGGGGGESLHERVEDEDDGLRESKIGIFG